MVVMTIQLCEYTKSIEMYTLMDIFYISLKLLQKEKKIDKMDTSIQRGLVRSREDTF